MILKLHICSICWKTKIIMILRVSCCEMETWKTGRKLELLQKHNHLNKRHYDICTLNTCAFFERIKRITFTPTRNILHKSSYITFSLSCHTSHNLTIILSSTCIQIIIPCCSSHLSFFEIVLFVQNNIKLYNSVSIKLKKKRKKDFENLRKLRT